MQLTVTDSTKIFYFLLFSVFCCLHLPKNHRHYTFFLEEKKEYGNVLLTHKSLLLYYRFIVIQNLVAYARMSRRSTCPRIGTKSAHANASIDKLTSRGIEKKHVPASVIGEALKVGQRTLLVNRVQRLIGVRGSQFNVVTRELLIKVSRIRL